MKVFVPLFSTRRPNPARLVSQTSKRAGPGVAASTTRFVSKTPFRLPITHSSKWSPNAQMVSTWCPPWTETPARAFEAYRSKLLYLLAIVVGPDTLSYPRVAISHPCQGWGRGFESLRPLQYLALLSAAAQPPSKINGAVNGARHRWRASAGTPNN